MMSWIGSLLVRFDDCLIPLDDDVEAAESSDTPSGAEFDDRRRLRRTHVSFHV